MSLAVLRQRHVSECVLRDGAVGEDALLPPAVVTPRKSLQDGDVAGGPVRSITLSAAGWLPKLCCSIPGMLLFPMMGIITYTLVFSQFAFYLITAVLTAFSLGFTVNISIGCAIGAFRLRRDIRRDWYAMMRKLETTSPEVADCMHIVILPNYKENEDMLQHTLENLGAAPQARSGMYVVLAMECREGPEGQQKAERLMQKVSHLFAGIVASYHPVGLPGDVPGKSSNTQWGCREALKHFSSQVSKVPASSIFVTVGDADTLWHPQFFSAMVYQAFTMSEEERAWSIWQPAMLLFRNMESVPAPTRASGYATLLFELAGMSNQWCGHHCCYSSYSTTLALAAHPFVGGWDRDVIAEDHHMFCKCYFASIWESLQSPCDAQSLAAGSKLRLQPVYLPALAYLVESDQGWFASIFARFQQARRHSQGVAELSYVFLQYFKLIAAAGFFRLPVRVHRGTWGIAFKMISVHLINSLQAFALTLASLAIGCTVLAWCMSNGAHALVASITAGQLPSGPGDILTWAIPAIFGPVPPAGIIMTAVVFTVANDFMEGRLGGHVEMLDSRQVEPLKGKGTGLGLRRKLGLLTMILSDAGMAEFTVVSYGLIPVILAAWSLLRQGTKFEYIVAAKPV